MRVTEAIDTPEPVSLCMVGLGATLIGLRLRGRRNKYAGTPQESATLVARYTVHSPV